MTLALQPAWEPAAHAYFLSAVLLLGIGGGVALYERFTMASRRFLLLAGITATWMSALGMAAAAGEPGAALSWLRVAFVADPFTAPAMYWLAASLANRRRRRVELAVWLVAAAFAAISVAGPWLVAGLQQATRELTLTGLGWLGALYFVFVVGVIGAGVWELLHSSYAAVTRDLKLESRLLALVGVLASLTLLDYWLPNEPYRVGMATPLSVGVAALLAALVASRFRVFALVHSFATEEVLRTLSDGVIVCDTDGRVRAANVAAQRLFGRSDRLLAGSEVGELIAQEPDGASPWRLEPREQLRDQRLHLLQPEGGTVAVSLSTEPLVRGGRTVGSVIVARDIRRELRAQRALEEAERRFRALFEYNPGVVYEIAGDGAVVAVNPAGEALLGAPAAGVVGRNFVELIEPSDRPEALHVFERVLSGAPAVYELGLQRPDGRRRRIRGVGVPVQEGEQVVSVLGVALDITDETRAQQGLEVQRRYYAELFEASPEAVALVGADGRVRRVNGEFSRLFGYGREEAVGRRLDDLIVPPERADEGEELTRLTLTGGVARAETVRRRKEGGLVDVSLLAREVRIPGEPPQMYAIYRDITDRRAAEHRLREREEELRHAQKLEAVGKLAGGIAHDFNNLLTVINGHTRFLLDQLPTSEPWRADLEEIERAGTRAASLTQQLLAFSRRQVLRPQVLDFHAVVVDLQRMLGRLIGEHIRLLTGLGAEDARVHADRGQLEQVLMNLIVNARDAMPHGGTLTIRTDTVKLAEGAPELPRWDVRPGVYLRVRVSDTGQGMPRETLDRIFEPFFTTKDRGKGTGLGLSTVFGIVKQTGGHVTAESVPGVGSTFTVLLPLAQAPTAAAQPQPVIEEEAAVPGAPRTVLVVEDELPVRRLAARVLERAGHTVLQAANGRDALSILDRHGPGVHLVVTDLVMPEMGGRDLRAALRSRKPDLPVVFMSGYDEEQALAGGDRDAGFLPKPFTPRALVDTVARALGAVPAGS